MSRGALRAAVATAVTVLATLALTVPAAQATTYRYWTYWAGDTDGWTYSPVGPASDVPEDGTVQGWRFTVTEGVRGQGKSPRLGVSQAFAQFCGSTPAAPGHKRVAVVLDFGDASDAPGGQAPPAARGTCVETEMSATGARILSSAAQVRTDRGLVCAIAGYPAGECAPAVETGASPRQPTQSTRPEPQSRGSSRAAGPATTPATAETPAGSGNNQEPTAPRTSPSRGATTADAPASSGGNGNSGAPTTSGSTGSPSSTSSSSPSASPTPGTPSPSTPSVGAVGAGPTDPPPPVFVEATTLESPTSDGAPAPWLPLAVTGVALAAIGGVIVWRRRGSRAPRW